MTDETTDIVRRRSSRATAPVRRRRAVARALALTCSMVVVTAEASAQARATEGAEPETGIDSGSAAPVEAQPVAARTETYRATAYALEGKTASGTVARIGIVAADPAVLPLGSRIRVTSAGSYSGEYVVEDTGPKVRGRTIDIRVATVAEAIRFGRRKVQVEVLRRGWPKKQ